MTLVYLLGTDTKTGETGRITDVAEESDPELQSFADENNIVLLALVGSYVPRRYGPTQFGWSSMSTVDEFSIEDALTAIMKEYSVEERKLYMLVNTPGGSVTSSFKISMAVRQCFDDITVFVPHLATSGGTMLALTGNRIRMGMMSQLGPVDIQVPYKDGYISANSMLTAEYDLGRRIAMKRPDELSYLEKHLADSLDPVIIVEMDNIVRMSQAYLSRILEMAGYPKEKMDKIVDRLIFELPTHEFVIQEESAKEIGIVVQSASTNVDEWTMMRKWFERYIGRATDKHFVRYVIPKKETPTSS